MKLLLVTASYWPFVEMGGPPVKVRAIAEGLDERGHDVTVLTADLRSDAEARRPPGRRTDLGGVRVRYLPVRGRYRNVPLVRGARGFARRNVAKHDAIQIFGLYDTLGPSIARAARSHGVPYLVEPMGMYLPIVRSQLKKRVFHLLLGRTMLAGAAGIIATAPSERDELIGGGIASGLVTVRRNGVDLGAADLAGSPGRWKARLQIPPDEPMVLFLGRLATKKHPDLLVEAFADAGMGGHLVFAGPDEDDWTPRLHALADARGVGSRVHVLGPVFDPQRKRDLFTDAALLALPSENENFGNTIAEAMACGVPVVITDRCGIAPLVTDRGGIVTPLDRAAFAGALSTMLGDEKSRARYGRGAMEVARTLSWDQPLDEEEALLERIVRARPGA